LEPSRDEEELDDDDHDNDNLVDDDDEAQHLHHLRARVVHDAVLLVKSPDCGRRWQQDYSEQQEQQEQQQCVWRCWLLRIAWLVDRLY
jgi:uncharacterized protein YbbK (DUF523 family)